MRRYLRILLMMLCLVLFYDITGGRYFTLAAGLTAAVLLFVPERLDLPPARRLIVFLLSVLPFALKFRYFPDILLENPQLNGHWLTIGQCMLSLMLLDLMFRDRASCRWVYVPLFFLALAAAIHSTGRFHLRPGGTLLIVAGFLVVLWDMSLSGHAPAMSPRGKGTARLPITAMLGAVILFLGYQSSLLFYTILVPVDQPGRTGKTFFGYDTPGMGFRGPNAGYAAAGKVIPGGSRLDVTENLPALHIFAEENPEYLRGSVYTTYREGEWEIIPAVYLVNADRVLPDMGNSVRYLYRIAPELRDTARMEVWLNEKMKGHLFLPYDCRSITAASEYLLRNEWNVPELPAGVKVYEVTYGAGTVREQLSPEQRRKCLDLPGEIKTKLQSLAEEIFAAARTPREKTAALLSFFHEHYSYADSTDTADEQDPVVHFLLESRSGHCQLFASGAAMLLRLAGVPTRYIQGFVISDYDRVNRCWVARNGSAHAWAEVWDDMASAWRRIDPTQDALRDEGLKTAHIDDVFGRYAFMFTRFCAGHTESSVLSWAGNFFAALSSWIEFSLKVSLGLLFTAAAALIAWIVLANRGARPGKRSRLRKLLRQVDRRAARVRTVRRSGETLECFAQRAAAAVPDPAVGENFRRFYREYGRLLYTGAADAGEMEKLRQYAAACVRGA